jgi:hypothetical protein
MKKDWSLMEILAQLSCYPSYLGVVSVRVGIPLWLQILGQRSAYKA